jgi:hypothetical protein
MSKTYTFAEAQQRADELIKQMGPGCRHDHVATEAVTPTDPNSRVRVKVRDVDDHTTWREA